MNVEITLDCPVCGKVISPEVDPAAVRELQCPLCGEETGFPCAGNIGPEGTVSKCVRCDCEDFYWQSDFNRGIGFGILLTAMALSFWLFYAGWRFFAILPMFAGAAVDIALYQVLPVVTVCYRCNAQYRNNLPNPRHGPHDLHTQE